MPPPLSWTIYLLVIALSGVAARAVNANITCPPTSNIFSPIPSESRNVATSSESCTDIKTCRTLYQLVVSCIGTILACVWFAVHRNISAPKQRPSQHPSAFVRAAQRAWSVVLAPMDAAMVFAVTLLVPEWILAWALRQAIVAWKLAKTLERARLLRVNRAPNTRCSGISDLEKDTGTRADVLVATDADSLTSQLIKRRSNPSTIHPTCDRCEGRGCQCDLFAAAMRIAKGDERWEWSHGFFVAMGGFYYYNKDGPLYPLSPADVIELVERGHLVPPTADEIANQSKGDAFSKGAAICQTLWFVVQCIARGVANLPVTSLEIMTLAYTVMTLAMYAAWWAKPLNVSCAIRVPVEEVARGEVKGYSSIWERVFAYVTGSQDDHVDLRDRKRVPTFWAGKADINSITIADGIALSVATVFGALHCIAWYFEFLSDLEQQLWRWSAITIIVVPVSLVVCFLPANLITLAVGDPEAVPMILGVLYTLIAIIYFAARLTLITISFTSLRGMHFDAYQTVPWTTFMPHV